MPPDLVVTPEHIIAALIGAGVIAIGVGFWLRGRVVLHSSDEHALRAAAQSAKTLQDDLTKERENTARLMAEMAGLEATREAETKAHGEKIAELSAVRQQIEKDMKILADSLLKDNSAQFMRQAKEVFEAQATKTTESVKTLVKPVDEALQKYQTHLNAIEQERKKDEGQLVEQLRSITETHAKLSDTTTNLVNAFKSAPKTRGRWGEQQLRTVLEMAGMMEFVDFETEKHTATDDGRLRPDVVIRLPAGRQLVVDAKTSLSAYLDAIEEPDEDLREAKLKEHAKQLRRHAMQLGDKAYWKHVSDTTDFVVMFVPGDNLYAAAIERDPDLFEAAYDKNVVIVTPTTLLALAKAVAFGWRQEKASQEARRIHELGTELYKRMVTLGSRVSGVTKALDTAVKRHNDFVGTLEGQVLPQARKFQDLSIGASHGELETLEHIESDVRDPVRGRDLEFKEPGNDDAA